MRHGSLFSGIGGFDLAAKWMGWENVFHCEWNEFGQKILKHYWPNAINYSDITKTDFTIHRGAIDILTGGFPCQPYSAAGKRLGTEDDRHLWPEMLRAIREIQPVYVVGENVRGLTNWNGGMVFDQVQADLENEGYQVTPFLLPACAVNAPHRRDRIWFVAYSGSHGYQSRRFGENRHSEGESTSEQDEREWIWNDNRGISQQRDVTDTPTQRLPISGLTSGIISVQSENGTQFGDSGDAADTGDTGLQGSEQTRNKYFERTQSGNEQFAGRNSITYWTNFPTQPPVCSRNDGLSDRLDGITFPKWRNESIKGYGNAIVPQVAYQIFKAIELT